ncbi:MAG: LemA family protein [Pseudomonadota bacterium]|nr:LemA family protein [Pseudomonadota bacterium]
MMVLVGALIVAVVVIYGWYAVIVMRKNKMLEALGGIDVHLKQRHDLIPNILVIARRFMEHEKTLMDDITRLRTQAAEKVGARAAGDVQQKFDVEGALGRDLGRLFVSVENYPQLRSNETMVQAQHTYSEVEANLAAARRFYNAAVNSLRNAVQIFPGNMLGRLGGVKEIPPFFEADQAERAPVAADSILKPGI